MSHDYMSWANLVMGEIQRDRALAIEFQKAGMLPLPSVQLFLPQEKIPVAEQELRKVSGLPAETLPPPAV